MKYNPLQVQTEGTARILTTPKTGIIIQMGVGKTVSVLTAIEQLMYNLLLVRRTLVVAPRRVATMVWPDEIDKWDHVRRLTYTVLHGKDKLQNLISNAKKVDVTLINYEGLQWLSQNSEYVPAYDMIVLDESTYIKNGSSGRTKLLHDFARNIPRVVILTGTPSPNGVVNFWSQVFVLDRGARLGANITTFRERYLIKKGPYTWVAKSGAKQEVLDLIKDIVLVVDDEQDVGLPPVKDNPIYIELTGKDLKDYKTLESKDIVELGDVTIDPKSVQAKTQKLRQLVSGFVYTEDGAKRLNEVKLSALKELRDSIDGNVLVAVNFVEEISLIRDYFKSPNMPAIYGGTSTKEGDKWIRKWMAGTMDMMLVHPQSLSHGLNLQGGGQHIVWFSMTWDLEYYLQLIARLRRRGSKYLTIFNHLLIVKDTIDEALFAAIQDKDADQTDSLKYLREYVKKLKRRG